MARYDVNSTDVPSFGELVRVSARIGCLSFGGPVGQIALMHRELVEQRRWISEEQYLHALNFCHLLPGPEAQQLAIWIGWKLHGVKGGLAAGVKFIESAVFMSHLANIGDTRTLIIHPASTTHRQLEPEQQLAAGVKPDMVRMSVGLENVDDILWDIDQALARAAG